ncbi:MAG: membrane anchor subunit of succinate dehydrogenase, Sdh4 [Caeruleum heppii]|nr:MAG: membrane anchor subunit of succinate dehydrogenase, Sdh4 [Caeruleum heppii]
MASIVRPTVFRQTCVAASFRRPLTTRAPTSLKTATASRSQQPSSFQKPLPASTFARNNVLTTTKIASFHSSSKRSILPPLPQRIAGTINDAAPVRHSSPTHGSYHWTFERLVSAALIPLTIAPFASGSLNPVTDAVLCATLLVHSHIGFESIIIDYLPTKRTPRTRLVFWWGLRAATLIVAVGLYEFETNDVGVTEAIKRIWTA